jgi:peptidoglycan/LPS O-acetylase OafA/YrhL
MSARYLSNLTPLRGIAALLTVIFHVDIVLSIFGGRLLGRADSELISRMYLMVDFFFILSGFIMCHVYAKYFDQSVNGQNFKKFAIARFARVYPLHIFSMFLTTFFLFLLYQWGAQVTPLLDAENSVFSLVTNMFLLHSMNVHEWFTFTHASWSISVEWWMYMVFPFLVAPFLRLSKPGRLLVVGLCIIGYLVIGFVLVPLVTVPDSLSFLRGDGAAAFKLDVSYQFGFFRCLFGFVIGMMVYLAWKDNWAKKLFSSGYTVLILLAGLFTCMHFAVLDVISVLFFPFILLAAAYGNRYMDLILGTKPLQKLGDWSFSIYLIHQPFLYQATALMQNPQKTGFELSNVSLGTSWLICIGFIVFLLFVSYLSYRFIELPSRNYINRRWGKEKVQPIPVLEARATVAP